MKVTARIFHSLSGKSQEKIRKFAVQAINSENDQKIGRKYNGNIADDFLRKTPL